MFTVKTGVVESGAPQHAAQPGPLVTDGDRQQPLEDWNDTAVALPDRCLHQLIEEQARRTPQQIAVVYEEQRLTYGELDRRANLLARQLQTMGVGPEVRVGLFVERSVEMVVALLGILKAGGAYVPMDIALPQQRIAFMLADANVTVVLTQRGLRASLPEGGAQVVCLDDVQWTATDGAAAPAAPVRPETLCYVIYTSGSTGRPKGVAVEHRNLLNYVLGVAQRLEFEPGMNHATVSTIAADLGNTVIFPALVTGGCLHVVSQERAENPTMLAEYFDRERIDVLKIVPSHLAALQSGASAVRVMPRRRLILGGEASRLEWIARLRALSPTCEIFNHYGPTEATVGVLTYHVGPALPKTQSGTLPLGTPLPNARVYIVDAAGQPVAVGDQGELCIGGRGVARGYLNRPDLTAQKFVPDPFGRDHGDRLYRTGDVARYLADGTIEFCGRMDDQVKLHGYRIELGEIEGALRGQGGVREAVVRLWEAESGDKHLVAYVVPKRAQQTLWGTKGICVLPDGSCVAHLNRNETEYIYDEVFVRQAYLRHGITIRDGDCIVDAGANIGMFTVFASRLARNLRIFSLEPNPAAFACLQANAEAWGSAVRCLPLGVSSENKSANLTFFEGLSLLSGFYADAATEREVVKTYVLNQQGGARQSAQLTADIEDVIDERLRAKTVAADLRTLSSILAAEGIERVDLLKVNVEKSELDVLRGLGPSDWPKIRQAVIEVDERKNLEPITTLFEGHGFDVVVEQDPLLTKTDLCYVYASRPSASEPGLIRDQPVEAYVPAPLSDGEEILTPHALREYLKARLPQYMIPSAFVLLDKLPLTANGKVDRHALPTVSREDLASVRDVVRPLTETERVIAAIWNELLNVPTIGSNDDFFDLGGHSLLAIRAVSRIRDVFGVDLQTRTLFEHPTLSGLATALAQAKGPREGAQRIEARTQGGPYPLSFAQERLWFLHQWAPDSPAYNIVDVIPFSGPYDARAMQQALTELTRRHAILRTAFSHREGQPVQVVQSAIELALSELDLTALPERDREREWIAAVRAEGRRPFDLSQTPLLRGTMAHVSRQEHRLLLTIHHIIADEWSMELIHKEVKELYEAFARGRRSSLPDLPIQYADFASWQREWLRGDLLVEELSYWKGELAGVPPSLDLATDKPRPPGQTFRGASEVFAVPARLVERLKALGRDAHATLFMVLEASFAALLHRYTGQDDILVGTPISGRTRSETEHLIGCFLNTVVLRSRFSDGLTFRSLLEQMRERALGAYAHPDLPFERLVADVAPQRDPSRMPLFQVMFVQHNAEGVSQVSKVSGNRQLETGTAKFDLTLIVAETANGLEGLVEYSTDLFEANTIRRLCDHYATLLDGVARDPDQSLATLPILSEDERHQQLVAWNDTAVAFPEKDSVVQQLIEEQAQRTPDQVALVFGDERLTYRELDHRADELAQHLKSVGVGPEVLVGLLVERSLDMVVALLGILKAGGAYLPLDPALPPDRLAYLVEDSALRVLVTHRDLDGRLPVPPPVVVRLDRDREAIGRRRPSPRTPSSGSRSDLAYVLYTSGSTGRPKGVAIPHSALTNFLLSMQRAPGFTAADTLLAVTTLSFDIAGLEIYLPLVSGGTVVIASRDDTTDPRRLMERIRASACTVMQATPATWRALVAAGWDGAPSLRVLCGGEALPQDLAHMLLPRCAELWNLYGPTETTVWSTIERITADAAPSIGLPIANTQVLVLDGSRNLIPRGLIGELYIGGAGVARGYWRRDELTRERFVPSPFAPNACLYRTGDLARWLADGRLQWLGRSDHQVKVRGFRIEPAEIEATIARHLAVREVVVIARDDALGEKQLIAYLVVQDAPSDLFDQLRDLIRAALPEYMVPAAFVRLDALPRTANGKLDRRALPAVTTTAEVRRNGAVAPRTPAEELVMGVFRGVIGRADFGVLDSFFDLGGHSLMAARLMTQLQVATGVDLPLRSLFERPTVAALAQAIEALSWSAQGVPSSASAGAREEIEL